MRVQRFLLLALVIVAVAGACGGDSNGGSVDRATPSPAPTNLTGVILSIDAEALGQVTSFELKAGDATHVIYIEQERDYGFNLGHLNEHLQTSEPVVVELKEVDDKLYALSIEDA